MLGCIGLTWMQRPSRSNFQQNHDDSDDGYDDDDDFVEDKDDSDDEIVQPVSLRQVGLDPSLFCPPPPPHLILRVPS